MAHRIRFVNLQVVLIILFANLGPFFGVNGLSSKGRLAERYSNNGRRDDAPLDNDKDIMEGPLDSDEIYKSIEYLINLVELMIHNFNIEAGDEPNARSYPRISFDVENPGQWIVPLPLPDNSECCSSDSLDTTKRDDEYRSETDYNSPPIQPDARSQLKLQRSKRYPYTLIPPPSSHRSDPFSNDISIPVNPPPMEPDETSGSQQSTFPIMTQYPQQYPYSPYYPSPSFGTPPYYGSSYPLNQPPMQYDGTSLLSMLLQQLFSLRENPPQSTRNKFAKTIPTKRNKSFFWPWNQNHPKGQGNKQLASDDQVNPDGNPDESDDGWPTPSEKVWPEETVVLPDEKASRKYRSSRRF